MFSPTPSPISRTVTYRKVTKPLLERKRRARINRCLDELKDLMFTALEAEGENVDKLEKADILEFTVKHLQKITKRDPVEEAYKFQEGFSQCASEACSFLLSLPGLDTVVGRRLVEYLAKSVSRTLETQLARPSVAAVGGAVPTADAVPSGRAPPSSSDPRPTTPQLRPPSPPPLQRCRQPAVDAPQQPPPPPPLKPAALSASNRGPHTVVRPKPTRPAAAFAARSPSLTPPHVDVAAAAAAAQRDPMWRPW